MKYRMYDKEKINELAKIYVASQTEQNFVKLLKELQPMIQKILLRYPKYEEHHEDLVQEVMIKICNGFGPDRKKRKNGVDLEKIFVKNIPSSYFFYRIKEQILHSLHKVDSSFQVKTKKKGKQRHRQSGYNHYEEDVVSFQDLTLRERIEIGLDDVESNGEYWE
jgi:hypothetical protein